LTHLLNLLAAIALLVWGTHLVRTGILRVAGASLRNVLAKSVSNRFNAVVSGLGVTALVQSSTATALIVASFVGKGLMTLPSALAVMLGADMGTSLMAVVFSRDLSWLSPLFILVGVWCCSSRASPPRSGGSGRVMIGLGLMLLALSLVKVSAEVLTKAPAIKALLASLSSDLLLEITVGAVLAVVLLQPGHRAADRHAGQQQRDSAGRRAGPGAGRQPGQRPAGRADHAERQHRDAPGAAGQPAVQADRHRDRDALRRPVAEDGAGPWVPDLSTLVVLYHLSFNIIVAILFIG
jgi:phosphate:Na+ symporter